MVRMIRYLASLVIFLSIVSLAMGVVFIVQGVSKENWMKTAMQQEKITVGLSDTQIKRGEVIDNGTELQVAGDTIRGHRHAIAPTYSDLLGGKPFDPTNPKQLTYVQGLNLENYLYLGVLGFGVTQVVMATGVFMIVMAIALAATGVALCRLSRGLT